jgi:hypothetical protein
MDRVDVLCPARFIACDKERLMPETYKGFRFEASAIAVAPGEFRGTALIFKGDNIVWREPNEKSFPTEAEARTEAEIIAPNVIDRLIESGELEE